MAAGKVDGSGGPSSLSAGETAATPGPVTGEHDRGTALRERNKPDDADLFEEKRAAGNTSEVSLKLVRAVKEKEGQFEDGEEQVGKEGYGLDEELGQVQDRIEDMGENEEKGGCIANGSVGPSSDSAAERGTAPRGW